MLYTILATLLAVAPLAAAPAHTQNHGESMQNKNLIQGEQLKSWYDQKKDMIVLDARSKPYFDGTLLPQAKWVSAESSEKEIQAAVPSKSSFVVVYCAGIQCPASGWLYDKLKAMGYQNVYEYHEGLEDWMQRGYPVTKK